MALANCLLVQLFGVAAVAWLLATTVVMWEQYYDASDLETNKAAFDEALTDIATQLAERFGGRIVERSVE